MRPVFFLVAALLTVLVAVPGPAAAQLVLDADVPADASEFVLVPFDVPAGTVEIEVRHDDGSAANILDWGLLDPDGFRGWGGGNSEPAVVGIDAASRSYLAGPIPAGTWQVVIGKAKILEPPGHYHLEIDLRTTPTLTPQPERTPYVPAAALETGARWYAGDFHVHSRESGDATPTIDELATFARGRGLDFVELSDHNTSSQVDFLVDAQSRHPDLLLLPGVEFTTYHGHANGIGATHYVSHLIGVAGRTIGDAVGEMHAQGALFTVNHPVLDLGTACIGCAWMQDVPPEMLDGVEIETGGYSETGFLFTARALAFWDERLATGHHLAAIGGSDDHRAGMGTDSTSSPIGDPTTMVYAMELSAAAIVDAVRAGRTVVKTQGPGDPMVELTASDGSMVGDTVHATHVTLRVHVTGTTVGSVRFVRNGVATMPTVPVAADPFDTTLEVDAPYGTAEDRWRVELVIARAPRVVTSHVYIAPQPGSPPPDAGVDAGGTVDAGAGADAAAGADAGAGTAPSGCGCTVPRAAGGHPGAVVLVALVAAAGARLRSRRR